MFGAAGIRTPRCAAAPRHPAAAADSRAAAARFAAFRPPDKPPRLNWAALHQRTFGTDVLRCPCGGRRSVRALYSTRKAAEERLASLGVTMPSRLLPPATAPPQLALAF